MPFVIRKDGPEATPYCVYTKGSDKAHGCHATPEEAEAQRKALFANVPEARKDLDDEVMIAFGGAVKAMGGGRIGVRLVPFGNSDDLDSDGEFFDAETDFDRDLPTKLSLYYHHGLDAEIGDRRLGRVEVKGDDAGLWFEHQLNMADDYESKIYQLAEMGKLGGSSGAVSHLVRKTPVGKGAHIDRWPLGEASILVTPSNPQARAVALKSWAPPPIDELLAAAPCETCGKQSLAENTERWIDRGGELAATYRDLAAKSGRKLSAARRARLVEMRQTLDDLLSETEYQQDDSTDTIAASRDGELPTTTQAAALIAEHQRLRLQATLSGVGPGGTAAP